MAKQEHLSDSELEDTSKITDPASCLDYLKRREVFLYKMMNDPSHKAMLYFLEVLMNSETPLTVEQLAARLTNKSFGPEMREACGGGSPDALKSFLEKYPSLFTIKPSGLVSAVAIDMPGFDEMSETSIDIENCLSPTTTSQASVSVGPMPSESQRSAEKKGTSSSIQVDTTVVSSTVDKSSDSGIMRQQSTQSESTRGVDDLSNKPVPRPTLKSLKESSTIAATSSTSSTNTTTNNNASSRIAFADDMKSAAKPAGIYQPPILRAAALSNRRNPSFCELCSVAALTACSHVATTAATTVVHCPLADLNCAHHSSRCAAALKHARSSHCFCTSPVTPDPMGHHRHSYCQSMKTTCVHSTMSMDNFMLETEAVKFFQQRLSRREERWVPIKSLAGHLSQASPEVRAVVGPQLEFRGFLLKHPHVFEVQGDLVGLKDPFTATCLSRRPKSFMMGANSSSSTNLSTLNHSKLPSQKVSRPKSLIMLSQASNGWSNSFRAPARGLCNAPSGSECYLVNHDRFSGYSACTPLPLSGKPIGTLSADPGRFQAPVARPTSHKLGGTSPGFRFDSIFSATPKTGVTGQLSDMVVSSAAQSSRQQQQQQQTSSVARHSDQKRSGGGGSNNTYEVGTENSNSICIRMSGNEYRAVMFLRKVLAKRGGAPGQPGLSYTQLMQILSVKAPESVQSAIGWTKIELEEFINQHAIFFEVHQVVPADVPNGPESDQSPVVTSALSCLKRKAAETSETPTSPLVTNRRVLKMINIVITGNRPADVGNRTLTNRCGRIFHVAKLWGIIDLGRHEHVFFDKSILKYVDDLQKHFKVDELLYFNAILAPKESRAKWRATQVWKECDKEIMEKLGGAAFTGHPIRGPRVTSTRTSDGGPPTADSRTSAGQGDSKAGETQNKATDPPAEGKTSAGSSGLASFDSDSDYGLVDDEEIEDEDPGVSALAQAEGLNLANDIKFLSDDVEEELERLLGPQASTTTTTTSGAGDGDGGATTERKSLQRTASADCYVSDEDTSLTGCLEDISVHLSEGSRQTFSELNSRQAGGGNSSRVTSTTKKTSAASLTGSAGSAALSERSSIAVQTLSTGDIMATQIFHDLS
uniref:Egal-1 winged helix domain-containing protein n=1 Tax=Schistocephalus solidus TaxID=70667 RepID=A0A0X3PHY1_SCHSO